MMGKDIFMSRQEKAKPLTVKDTLFGILAIVLIPICILLIPVFVIYLLGSGLWFRLLVKLKWYPQKKYLLFVYSNSPNWKEYIEFNILPKISSYAVVINWSERSDWDWKKKPLELKIFQRWTGVNRYFFKGKKKWDGKEFNPVAITFLPWWRCKVFRFWQPFRDYKHGKEKPLKDMETKLFKVLESVSG